uniref:Ribosomal protein S14-like protein n=1 Tax=Equus caballus TaxID=9796 RepID=A9YYF6_HORSE|nr:ribosomal protein S14-like protein [Equus caballus]
MIRLHGRHSKTPFALRKGRSHLHDCLYPGGGCDWMWGVKAGKPSWKEPMERQDLFSDLAEDGFPFGSCVVGGCSWLTW